MGGSSTDLAGSVDNAYLKWGLELGYVGLSLFALVLVALWLTGRETWLLARDDPELGPLAAGIFSSLLVMLVVSASVATFTVGADPIDLWTLVGAMLAIRRLVPLRA